MTLAGRIEAVDIIDSRCGNDQFYMNSWVGYNFQMVNITESAAFTRMQVSRKSDDDILLNNISSATLKTDFREKCGRKTET